jgi:hypothetical protein
VTRPLAALAFGVALAAQAQAPATELWRFDNLTKIGGHAVIPAGHPKLIDTPYGKAVEFNGDDDGLFIDSHPLAGASAFTWEVIFRPATGGKPEQRFFHLQVRDPETGNDIADRLLFEIRVIDNQWALDAFATAAGASLTLLDRSKLHALDTWHRVEMVYDGAEFRSYVDGVLQGSGPVKLAPQGAGHASAGVRINRRDYFKGAILLSRTTPRALQPADFLPLPPH